MTSSVLRTVQGLRYVLALREGGSLPGLVEADDLGTYVVKFRGAGQGLRTLVAEAVVGELARVLGFPVPELVVVAMDPHMASAEPDEEVQDLLRSSGGTNLGIDYLPGALGLELSADAGSVVDADLAADIVWLDAWTMNVDRTWRNPNMLVWHGTPWLIDHGAALYFHHDWVSSAATLAKPTPLMSEHVLLPIASDLHAAHTRLAAHVTDDVLDHAVSAPPDEWLADASPDVDEVRLRYRRALQQRLASPDVWLEPVEVARAARL
jgi:hypothetical protein